VTGFLEGHSGVMHVNYYFLNKRFFFHLISMHVNYLIIS
jgi:hypothetical protein